MFYELGRRLLFGYIMLWDGTVPVFHFESLVSQWQRNVICGKMQRKQF